MATYKVPQDVEADDKLLGPFSFRQVVYLAIAIAAGVVAWGLSKIFIPLAIIPAPIIIVFLILALPLRKDQPMETYAAAMLSFFIKPRRRLWYADGVVSLIEVTQPSIEEFRGKGLTEAEASERLSYLSQLVDTQGWAVRGLSNAPTAATNLTDDVFFDSQSAEDMLDQNSQTNQLLGERLAAADTNRRDALIAQFKSSAGTAQQDAATQAVSQTQSAASLQAANNVLKQPQSNPAKQPEAPEPAVETDQPADSISEPSDQPVLEPQPTADPAPAQAESQPQPAISSDEPKLVYSPYPNTMRQSIIHPISDQPAVESLPDSEPDSQPDTKTTQTDSSQSDSPRKTTPHPDIINLASNSDLSVETIAHEAKRINKKYDDDEIVLQLH